MKGLPFRQFGIETEGKEIPEPIATHGRAQEEGAAAGCDEHGADDFRPDARVHESCFVQHSQVQAFAAQVIRGPGGADGDHATVRGIDALAPPQSR